ncbi:MAG: hypothetical protein K0S07_1174 [Chlamydiales bacterium]|nr:hypothetical protein [Chlamydiales bacterium]
MNSLILKDFYFVRHGQTDWNVRQLCQGQTDIELNSQGMKEAQAVAQKLQSLHFDAIYSSHLKRAEQTAQIIREHLGARSYSLELVEDLQERYWGSLEGDSSEKMYAFEREESAFTPSDYQKTQVESLSQFKERIVAGINACLKKSAFPLIVSHGRVFYTLCQLLGIGQVKQLPNAWVTHCQPHQSGWRILDANGHCL